MPGPSRLEWVVEQLGLRPDHRVLEIGCGHGVAANHVVDLLRDGPGHYVGVARSPAMVAASERRAADAVRSGRARFACADVSEVALEEASFDRVFAARVAALARPDALARLRRWVAPGGVVLLAFDDPSGDRTRRQLTAVSSAAPGAGLTPLASGMHPVDGGLVGMVTLSR